MTKPKAGYTPEQRAHKNATAREWHKNNPEKAAEYARRQRTPATLQAKCAAERLRRYGLTQEQFDAMLVSQGSKCAICFTPTPGGRWETFHVDHCHDTLRVRGLLCSKCNTGLGQFNDSPAFLQNAITYLTRDLTK